MKQHVCWHRTVCSFSSVFACFLCSHSIVRPQILAPTCICPTAFSHGSSRMVCTPLLWFRSHTMVNMPWHSWPFRDRSTKARRSREQQRRMRSRALHPREAPAIRERHAIRCCSSRFYPRRGIERSCRSPPRSAPRSVNVGMRSSSRSSRSSSRPLVSAVLMQLGVVCSQRVASTLAC